MEIWGLKEGREYDIIWGVMKKLDIRMVLMVAVSFAAALSGFGREITSFNEGWSFAFEGEKFAAVEVPHDWAIAGPFDFEDPNIGWTGKLPWVGKKGIYKKTLVLTEKPKGRVWLDFDGVMMHATVKVNGQACGRGDYGYLGFRADASAYLLAGTNVIEVVADTREGFWARWYPGGGMYRKVTMVEADSFYLEDDSVRFEAKDVLTKCAAVKVGVRARNLSRVVEDAVVVVRLVGRDGEIAAEGKIACGKVARGAKCAAEIEMEVKNPHLWKMEKNAYLYRLEIGLFGGEGKVPRDEIVRKVGLREFKFDADKGFILNGERVQLKGVDLHSDLGPLGMAFDCDAARRQLEIMVDMGVNALRTSHNPPAVEMLEMCDEMGIFVWDECFDKWDGTSGRGERVLEDFVAKGLRNLVRRDRLHPSVFVWSIGNEITPGDATPPGQEAWGVADSCGTSAERCSYFAEVVREEDGTRAVGIGSCFPQAVERGDYEALDVTGWNYAGKYRKAKAAYPKQAVLYTESASALSDYGFYRERAVTNKVDYAEDVFCVDSYDLNSAYWSDVADREFVRMEEDKYCGGEFVWTGIDYLGEPTPYASSRSSYFGICDLMVLPKDRYWLYRSYWNKSVPTLHIVPAHWNFEAGKKMRVFVYTNEKEAELFVNGKSLGRRKKNPKAGSLDGEYYSVLPRYRLIWEDVAWEAGEVKVVAYGADGKVVNEKVMRTAGDAAKVVLKAEKRYGNLCVVEVGVADKDGNRILKDNRRIGFAAEGCEILAVGNSDPRGAESFKDVSGHSLKNGRAAVFVRVKDGEKGVLRASAEGLEAAVVTF
jgi:beta-galactosidase